MKIECDIRYKGIGAVAEKLGVTTHHLREVLRGRRNPKILQAKAKALKITLPKIITVKGSY